jgi:hypothetical protein
MIWITLIIVTLFTILGIFFLNSSKSGDGGKPDYRFLDPKKDKTPEPKLPPGKGPFIGPQPPGKGVLPPPVPKPPVPKPPPGKGMMPPPVPIPRPPPGPPPRPPPGPPPKPPVPIPRPPPGLPPKPPVPIPRPPPGLPPRPPVPIPRPPPPQPRPPIPIPPPKQGLPVYRPPTYKPPVVQPPAYKPPVVPPNWYKNPPAWYKIPPAYKPPTWFKPLVRPPPKPGVAWLPPPRGPRPVLPVHYIYAKPPNLPSYLRWWNPTKYGGYVPGMYDAKRWELRQNYIDAIRAGQYPRGYMPLYPEYRPYYKPIPGWNNPYEGKYVPIPYYLYKQFGFDYGYNDELDYGETLFVYRNDQCPYGYTKLCDAYNTDPNICRCVEDGTIDRYTNQVVGQPLQPIRPYLELPPGGRRTLEEVQQMWASVGCSNVNFPKAHYANPNSTWFTGPYSTVIADMQQYQAKSATDANYYDKCYGTTTVPNNNPVETKLGAKQCPTGYYTVECKSAPNPRCKAKNWTCMGGCKCIKY